MPARSRSINPFELSAIAGKVCVNSFLVILYLARFYQIATYSPLLKWTHTYSFFNLVSWQSLHSFCHFRGPSLYCFKTCFVVLQMWWPRLYTVCTSVCYFRSCSEHLNSRQRTAWKREKTWRWTRLKITFCITWRKQQTMNTGSSKTSIA